MLVFCFFFKIDFIDEMNEKEARQPDLYSSVVLLLLYSGD